MPDREAWLADLTPAEALALQHDWSFWARPDQRVPPGEWVTWVIQAGRGYGKALALDTLLPTPEGWTTMREIRVGDQLFDERGHPCLVTFVTEIQHHRICYDVMFSDGSMITADADHQWLTYNRRTRKALRRRKLGAVSLKPQCQPRYAASIVTTEQIRESLYDGREVNHAVPCAGALVLPHVELPIHPYVLGVWLGDGDSNASVITSADDEVLHEVERCGVSVSTGRTDARSKAVRYAIGLQPLRRSPRTGRMLDNDSLYSCLKRLHLLTNKHIPSIYFRASVDQRIALLQGLMDTDGHITRIGACEFTSTTEALADGVFELCATLGLKPHKLSERAKLYGKDCGPKYRITCTPHIPIFRLPRKLARQHSGKRQQLRNHRRYIVQVMARPSVPVRCIQVDSPSHIFLAGRAMIPTHNTRIGAEWILSCARTPRQRLALIGKTPADVRDTMIEGESGIMSVASIVERPRYEPTKRRLTWRNGTIATAFSGETPDALRGPQHHHGWIDELAKFKYAQKTWDMFQFGLRLGETPQALITTTPRPIPALRSILSDPTTVVTKGSTYANAENLAPSFLAKILKKYHGTRLGRQEIEGILLEDTIGALWTYALLDRFRVDAPPPLRRIVIAIDPAGSSKEDADETGIIVAGLGDDAHGYVLHDATAHFTPAQWGAKAVSLFNDWKADCIVGEVNNGGEMVGHTVQMAADALKTTVRFKAVHASKGKHTRAEPVSALDEQGRIHHVGTLPELEDELCTWMPGMDSPDRMDARVWAITELMLGEQTTGLLDYYASLYHSTQEQKKEPA